MRELTHLSLFSGIGGLDLAAEMAGFKTVGQCEWADYPTKILEKHWKDVPRWKDIRTLTGDSFYERTGLRTVSIISGGFPCQPFSVAGLRRGKEDDRYLWGDMLRIISELNPTWVLGENVPGIIDLALDTVLSDLENIEYSCQTFIIPACGVDAPHRRYRVAILANSCGKRLQRSEQYGASDQDRWGRQESYGSISKLRQDVPNSKSTECEGSRREAREWGRITRCGSWWSTEPNVGRVANGIPHRVDRLKCLGNAVVPYQFYPFFKAIADIENKED